MTLQDSRSFPEISIGSLALCASGILFLYYRYFAWHYGVFKRLGINGPQPYPVVGTMLPLMKEGLMRHDTDLKKYGSLVGIFQGPNPILMIYDLEILKQILVKDFSNFTNRFNPGFSDDLLGKMLLMLKDEHWKHVRHHLIQTFSSGKLRKMNGKMLHCVETFLKNLEKKAENQEIFDLRELCGAFTMDVIASTSFGLQIDSHNDPNNMFVQMGKKAFEFNFVTMKALLIFLFPFLIKPLAKLGIPFFPKDSTEFFAAAVQQVMSQRQAGERKDDVDFIQLMVNAHTEHEDNTNNLATENKNSQEEYWTQSKGLTYEEVLSQGIMFFLVGHDTTANTLALFGYRLAVHQDVQDKLIKEIDEVMKDQKHVTYELVQKMPYLDMCVSEILRLYPAGPRSDRVAKSDVVINGVFIPKGMTVGIPIYALQNDPEVWPNPEKFDPERFTPEAKESRDQFSYCPFGMGPRNCVGMRLALMELKMSMVHILQRLKFVACEQTEIPLKMEKLKMAGVNGIRLKMQKR